MAKTTPSPAIIFLTFLLLITPPPSQPLPDSQNRNLFLAHSLMTRVANIRARNIAAEMDRGLGLGVWGFLLIKFGVGFWAQGTLREVVKAVQRGEVVEGELLRDCLELGSNDLQGVLQILKDLGLQYASNSNHQDQ